MMNLGTGLFLAVASVAASSLAISNHAACGLLLLTVAGAIAIADRVVAQRAMRAGRVS